MADLRLTNFVQASRCTDLDLTNGRASLVTGVEEIAQRIRIKLQTQLGESVYDRSGGTPYLQIIFAPGATEVGIRAAVVAVVASVTGVREVKECFVRYSGSGVDKTVHVSGTAIADLGEEVPFATSVQGGG